MCFYNDYDWYADFSEETRGAEGKATRCDECGKHIAEGQFRYHLFQQEHEYCYECEGEDACEGGCDLGETFDYDRCLACDQVLTAIIATETMEGCPEHTRQPRLCEMYQEIFDAKRYGGTDYRLKAIADHPSQLLNRRLMSC